jgi:DNA-binding transcriptional LysR family regulator
MPAEPLPLRGRAERVARLPGVESGPFSSRRPETALNWTLTLAAWQLSSSVRISVEGRIIVNDTDLAVRAAVDGLGIAYTIESLADPFLRSGQLVRVLADWSPSFNGLFLYYPGHRQVPVALRALIDMLRSIRGSVPAEGSFENPFAAE